MTPGSRTAAVQRASVAEWSQAALLVANLTWTTLCLGGFRPETRLVTFVLTALLLIVHFVAWARESRSIREVEVAGWVTLPFLGYAGINVMTVTPVPWLGGLDWLGWANLIAVFWVARNGFRSLPVRQSLFLTLVGLGLVGVLLASYQRFVRPDWLMLGRQQAEQFFGRASGSFGIPNSFAGFLLLLLPATGALTLRRYATAIERVWWGWLTAVFAFGLLLTVSRGGWLALAVVLVLWPLGVRAWTWRRRGVVALAILIVVTGVGAGLHQASPSVRQRFDGLVRDAGELSRPILWRAAWTSFQNSPFTGTGAGSYSVEFERHRPAGFIDEPQWAHNDFLNTLGDYGMIGLLLLVGAASAILVRVRRQEYAEANATPGWLDAKIVRQGFALGTLAFALQACVDFHFKIPALAMTFAVVAALAMRPTTRPIAATARLRSGAGRVAWLLAAASVAILMLPMTRFLRAEALRYTAREAMDEMNFERPGTFAPALHRLETDLQRATVLAPGHGQAWADLALALELRAALDPGQLATVTEPALAAAERALTLSRAVPEFWIRLGVALDMASRRAEAEEAFANALRLAPRHAHGWYYYAYHLSFDTNRRDAALRAIATCLSLDPGNGAAEALSVKLNERSPGVPVIP